MLDSPPHCGGCDVRDLDVLIVGAGPTGLSLATQLHLFGARFRIIDRQLDRGRESRALGVQARTLELLQTLDLGERLATRGNTGTRVKLHLEGRAVAMASLGDIGAVDTRFPYILFVSQAETESVFHEYLHAAGVVVERGVELVSFERVDDGLQCRLQGDGREERVHARFLIGCDGAHSTVRKQSGIAFEGGSYPQDFALGDIEADGPLEPGAINSFVGGGGVAMFFPLGRPTTWRVIAMNADLQSQTATSATAGDMTLAELQALVDPPTSGGVRLREPALLTRFHLHHRQTARYRLGNVFLAGDAAHIHSPVGAQGMNTGIQDSWNLGWKLALVARGLAAEQLLDTYEDERYPVGQFLLRYTDRLFSTFTRGLSGGPVATWARRAIVPHVVPRILGSRTVRRTAFAFVSELGIRYRKSPAVVEGSPRLPHGPRAGDRLPDAEVLINGNATWLQQALAGPHLALLLCGDDRQWDPGGIDRLRERYGQVMTTYRLGQAGSAAPLIDEKGDAFTRLGVRDAAQYLIRPDGYIAFRSSGRTFEQLERYLGEWYQSVASSQ
jgi:2-polyprenyl-6-methoxyphenol hydroxylase-like FAD-dependent oxidoreductase